MKKLSMALAALMLLGTLAACGNGSSSTAGETPEAPAPQETNNETPAENTGEPSGDATELSLWYYWETEGHQISLDGVIQQFNASQDEIQVTASYVPFADFKKQLSIGASADELPDIVILDSPDHASYTAMGIFADITDKVDLSTYFDGPVDSASLDGRLYGIPFGVNCLALYYNEDMLADANVEVPTSWDDLQAAAAALTTDSVGGMAFCSVQNEEGTFNFMPWVWSTGVSSFDIDSEGGIRALTMVQSLVSSGSMPKESINWTQGDVMNQFISGNIAMMINGPWQVPTMRAEATDVNWNVALIPMDTQYASVLGGENFAVIDNDNVDASLAFLQFATSAEMVASYINDFGYIAARSDVADGQFDDDEIMQAFVAQMEYAQPRGPHPSWPEISDAISLAFNEVITETATPEQAAAKAQATIDGIIG